MFDSKMSAWVMGVGGASSEIDRARFARTYLVKAASDGVIAKIPKRILTQGVRLPFCSLPKSVRRYSRPLTQ